MRILFIYYNHPTISVIQRSLLHAFKNLGHEVITCGKAVDNVKVDIAYTTHLASLPDILTRIAKKPDLVLMCWPSVHFFVTDIEKSAVPTAVYAMDTELPLVHARVHGYVKLFDYIFCALPEFCAELQKEGFKNSYWCPYASDLSVHINYHVPRKYECVFVGTTHPLHNPRRSLFLTIVGKFFSLNRTSTYGTSMAHVYSKAKIILNISGLHDLNARVFEALACGGLLITSSDQIGLTELFRDRVHLVTYTTIADSVRKIKFYLRNDTLRNKIARQGEKEVRTKHTYQIRASFILSKIKDNSRNPNTRNRRSSSECMQIALSYYLLGSGERATHWLQEALHDQSLSLFEVVKIRLLRTLVKRGGTRLQQQLTSLWSKASALYTITWQLTHL